MIRTIVIAGILTVSFAFESVAQKQRRADRTASGRAAYGIATVSGKGKIGKVKKKRRDKVFGRKKRGSKSEPSFRKKQAWAG